MSAADADDRIAELFSVFGPVRTRRMFSGAGIFCGSVMIALMVREAIYLKADAETIPRFKGEGLGPFTYSTKSGHRALTSYWRMPERLYDDAEELAVWAREAHAAALRAGASRTTARRRKPQHGPARKNKGLKGRRKPR